MHTHYSVHTISLLYSESSYCSLSPPLILPQDLELEITNLPPSRRVGSVVFMTERLKEALVEECRAWKLAFGKALNQKCATEMDEVLDLFDNLMKRLCRPVKDLDDVRGHMGALAELRENEIRLDMTITPIEEAYAILNKFELYFNDGNAERVDSLTYGYSKLRAQAQLMQDHLLEIQPKFKDDLLDGVRVFTVDVGDFVGEYDLK